MSDAQRRLPAPATLPWIRVLTAVLLLALARGEDKPMPQARYEALARLELKGETASWMSCFHQPGSSLDQLTLKDLCLPGTHDSGALQVLAASEKLATPWVVTQQLNLLQQLQAGARRFDLRVMKVPAGNSKNRLPAGFYLHHGGYATLPLDEALRQIKSYLDSDSARTETILFEFSHFQGFQRGQHAGSDYAVFLSQVQKMIGPHLLRRTKGAKPLVRLPLKDLKGKAVLLVETGSLFEGQPASPLVHRLHDGLPIYDRYANRDRTDQMVADQAEKFRQYDADDSLFLLNWTLTPRPSLGSLGGVRKLAKEANAQLRKHFQDPRQPFGRRNPAGHLVNLINVDFFGGRDCQVLATCVETMRQSAVRK